MQIPVDLPPVGQPAPDPGLIDYDKLALAILKHSPQGSGGHLARSSEVSPVPPTTAQACDNHQNGTIELAVPGPSTPHDDGQQTNCLSGSAPALGELIDKVFAGEPARSTVHSISAATVSDGIPLGASVSSKIKSKIWNNEFIDFRSLQNTREEPLSVSISTGVIQLHQSPKFKSPISIAQWTDAFLVFAAIYIEKHPAEAPNLLKYGHMIRELQQLHGDNAFRSYDEQFRKLKENVNVPWQQPNQELRLKAATLSKALPPKQSQTQPFRIRYCFQYNRGERCGKNPCPFRHSCIQCKGNHPKSKCTESFKSGRQSTQSKTPYTNQNKKSA
jgi:hypothetical protein